MALNNKDWLIHTKSPLHSGSSACGEQGKGVSFGRMESRTQKHDIGLAWNWEYDRDFLQLIFSAAQARDLSTFLIDHQNLADTFERLKDDSLGLRFAFSMRLDLFYHAGGMTKHTSMRK
jgi:hypothetical protein